MAYVAADYKDVAQQLYIAYYGRPADHFGLTNMQNALLATGVGPTSTNLASNYATNSSLKTIIDGFGNSSESTTLYGTGTTASFVNAIFNHVLNRDALVAGLDYWVDKIDNGGLSRGNAALAIMDGALANTSAQGLIDAAAVANKTTVANDFWAAMDTVSEITSYSGSTAAASARTMLQAVTNTTDTTAYSATVTSTLATIVTGATAVTPQTLTLTLGADNLTAGAGDDTITGSIGTLSNVDEIHGGAGTDTLTVTFAPEIATAGAATAAAPIVSAVEILNITSRSESALLNLVDIKGVTALNVAGNNALKLTNLDLTAVTVNGLSGTLSLDLATATASTAAYGMTINASGLRSVIWSADDSGSTALVDTLTLNAQNAFAPGSASNISGVDRLVLQGSGNVTLNLGSALGSAATTAGGGISAASFVDLTAANTAAGIDASGLSGTLTLRVAAGDFNIKGGLGNDTFNLSANLNTNDTIDGGSGSDTINAIMTGGYIRPIISNVETLNLLINSTAVTADLRDVSGVSTLGLLMGTGVLVDRALTSMNTINVNSSDSTANALTVQYGTAAVASDVTLNLSNGAMSVLDQTAVATATGLGIGTITFSGNSGGLTIITNSTAKYSAANLNLKDSLTVTLQAGSANFVVDSAANLGAATTLNLNAAAAKSLTIGDDLSADSVTTFNVSAAAGGSVIISETANIDGAAATISLMAGATGLIDFSAVTFCGADTINIGGGVSALTTAVAVVLGQAGATAGSGAVALDTLTITGAGDVSFASFGTVTAVVYTAISLNVNVDLGGSASNVGISSLSLSDVAQGETASEQSINFTISGGSGFTGATFTLSAAAIDSSNITYHINSTGLASGNGVVINLAGVNDTGSEASAVFGANSATYVGIDGVDNIEAGLGAQTLNGGLGNDSITLNNTAATRVEFSANASALAGLDTIHGAGAGDVILFAGAGTAAVTAGGTAVAGSAVLATGTATTGADVGAASYTAGASGLAMSAIDRINIYTSNGDTIIEVLVTTGTDTGLTLCAATAGDQFVRVTLSNKDFAAMTASFQINSTASGLSVTLL